MMFSSIVLCDKPFMGSPVSKQGAQNCLEKPPIDPDVETALSAYVAKRKNKS